jgi:hypothetical protein
MCVMPDLTFYRICTCASISKRWTKHESNEKGSPDVDWVCTYTLYVHTCFVYAHVFDYSDVVVCMDKGSWKSIYTALSAFPYFSARPRRMPQRVEQISAKCGGTAQSENAQVCPGPYKGARGRRRSVFLQLIRLGVLDSYIET